MTVVLSYGLGVDSTALLLRWLEEPTSRDFDLADLLVVTAMTGDEWPQTGALVTKHLLPRLREHGVRFAQVARGGHAQADGVKVLDDTTAPTTLYLKGAYTLSDELTRAGTIPNCAGNRRCSMKFKGWVIDTFLAAEAPEAERHAFGYESTETGRAERCAGHMPRRLVFGFEAGEAGRAKRATEYDSIHRVAEFPLIEWGWDREACEDYIERVVGVRWVKSACSYCPFALTNAAGRSRTLDRMEVDLVSATQALLLEHRALCLNSRQGLVAGDRLADLATARGGQLADALTVELARTPHNLYEVRRVLRDTTAARKLSIVAHGTRDQMLTALQDEAALRGAVLDASDGITRGWLRRRGDTRPTGEHFLVAGPEGAIAKERPSFERWWTEMLDHPTQLDLNDGWAA
jgi:hypothetical protein